MKKLLMILIPLFMISCMKTSTETITVEEVIDYDSTYKIDYDLPVGKFETISEGVNGLREVTYEIHYTNDKEVSRVELDSKVLIEPVKEVVRSGAKSEPKPFEPTEDQFRMIQAWSQLTLERYGINDDTSSQLKDWNIVTTEHTDYVTWIITTKTNTHPRIKWVFNWTGNDEDDGELTYLLVDGEELLNELTYGE